MKKVFLLDGSGFMFRAYYAFPQMQNDAGQNTNVIYGFFRMLIKIMLEKPDYLVIARDAPTKTFRHEKYPEYKANRPKTPDDFKEQIPFLQSLVNELNIPNILAPWYEADDIMATLAQRFSQDQEEQKHTTIYSADKDLKQLLCENIDFFDPNKQQTITTKEFLQEFVFPPASIIDYLALVGDGADNIKGVPWIGTKTAIKLIQKFWTIEQLYKQLDEVDSQSVRKKLVEGRGAAFESKDLIKLCPVPALEMTSLENYKLNLNFDSYTKILIQENHFTGLKKPLSELKNIYTMPQQTSLFG